MIEGVRIGLNIAAQPALRAHIKGPNFVPKSPSDADVWDYVRQYAGTLYHPTSTCAIGPVVDSELRVHGVESLRVADASVMPIVVRGNTNAPTIMIAEKTADLIRGARSASATAA
jgi:choline dehydrogenase